MLPGSSSWVFFSGLAVFLVYLNNDIPFVNSEAIPVQPVLLLIGFGVSGLLYGFWIRTTFLNEPLGLILRAPIVGYYGFLLFRLGYNNGWWATYTPT